MSTLNSRVVIITGGGSGIGKATAARFLKEGAIVYINGRKELKLIDACHSLREVSGTVAYVQGDVSKVADCKKIVTEVADREGRIDVVVNSAGVWIEGPSEMMTEELWDRCIDINLKGTFFVCRYAIPYLQKSQGCIVNVSSDSGLMGNKEGAIYCASKGGVTLLTKALAVELAMKKIRVNAVCLGDVQTPMLDKACADYGGADTESYYQKLLEEYPQGHRARFTRPEEVAETIFFLSQPEVEAITGATLSIDFGLTAGY